MKCLGKVTKQKAKNLQQDVYLEALHKIICLDNQKSDPLLNLVALNMSFGHCN
jgi:hypothetical protein